MSLPAASAVGTASADSVTARAFSESWNRQDTVYNWQQFLDWFEPLQPDELLGKSVIELGFGNGSLLYHVARCGPSRLCGVELGDTHARTRRNLSQVPEGVLDLHQGDLTRVELGRFDVAYCIGVLHHLEDPRAGFEAVLRHTRPGGRFHCWVYAREGNGLIVGVVDPLRRITSRLPWWFTKYLVALPLVVPYFVAAKALRSVVRAWPGARRWLGFLPLFDYSLWIAERPFWFFHHVAFDQLVTPRTAYLSRSEVEQWLQNPRVEPDSSYLVFRNRNSWKFGGRLRADEEGP
jgi:SAM-dependent methyltransferase